MHTEHCLISAGHTGNPTCVCHLSPSTDVPIHKEACVVAAATELTTTCSCLDNCTVSIDVLGPGPDPLSSWLHIDLSKGPRSIYDTIDVKVLDALLFGEEYCLD